MPATTLNSTQNLWECTREVCVTTLYFPKGSEMPVAKCRMLIVEKQCFSTVRQIYKHAFKNYTIEIIIIYNSLKEI